MVLLRDTAKTSAEKILPLDGRQHPNGRNLSGGVKENHFGGLQIRIGVRTRAGSDRNDEQLIFTRRPIEIEGLYSSHEKRLKGGIVVHSNAAVDEDKFFLS